MLSFMRRPIYLIILFNLISILGLTIYWGIQMITPATIDVTEARFHNVENKLNKLEKGLIQQSVMLSKMKSRLTDNSYVKHECIFDMERVAYPDIQMLDLYKKMKLNSKFSAWMEWNINYDNSKYNENNKLQVFVVPFSHIDPGWLTTYDNYYITVKHILNEMFSELKKYESSKFIWSEISYFAEFYESLSAAKKRDMKSLVNDGQLEFVTGGWVMTDEANSHWFSILVQLTEGHRYLKQNFNITPKTSWSIDPFGYSPTLPYLLTKVGIKNLVIQRTHHLVKRRLGSKQQLEFLWRQLWDDVGDTEVFTHMMPFVSYDIKHSCGPNTRICQCFDFAKADWLFINNGNLTKIFIERAKLLVDQWKRKAELYKTGVLLMPLGDDFRYLTKGEWERQRENFNKLFDIINNKKEYSVIAKFGTIQDYFNAVHAKYEVKYPTLSGDFFTYSDFDGDYWSGYFTSRPLHKRLDRILFHYLRSAEILSAWCNGGYVHHRQLQAARRALSLFQHHDAITGTSKAAVMQDYKVHLLSAIESSKNVMKNSIYRLLTNKMNESLSKSNLEDVKHIHLDDPRWINPEQNRTIIESNGSSKEKYITLHNSLPQKREETIELLVDAPFVVVIEMETKKPVKAQIHTVWNWESDTSDLNINPTQSTIHFRLLFKAQVPPFGLTTYILQFQTEEIKSETTFAKSLIFATSTFIREPTTVDALEIEYNLHREIELGFDNGPYIRFSIDGFIKSIRIHNDSSYIPISLEFIKYEPSLIFKSGAYLFNPRDSGNSIKTKFNVLPTVVIVIGELECSVTVGLPFVIHQTILRVNEMPEIRNFFHIKETKNQEIAMRFNTDIESDNTFYTDLNGLQLIKRQRFSSLPIQGNYYPVSTAIYIEDAFTRLTILSGQPLGGSSLEAGTLEIMNDRRLYHDDNRGLNEGVVDNQPVLLIFRVLLENVANCMDLPTDNPSGVLTHNAYRTLQATLYPVEQFVSKHKSWWGKQSTYNIFNEPFEDDIEMVAIRSLLPIENMSFTIPAPKPDKYETGIVVHRTNFLMCTNRIQTTGLLRLGQFKNIYTTAITIRRSTITFTERFRQIKNDKLMLCPMETKAIILTQA